MEKIEMRLRPKTELLFEENLDKFNSMVENGSPPDLRDCNLSGLDLRKANLKGLDLSGSYLRSSNLRGVDLTGCNLRGASLQGTLIKRCPLSRKYNCGRNHAFSEIWDPNEDFQSNRGHKNSRNATFRNPKHSAR